MTKKPCLACFENGKEHTRTSSQCRAYAAQVTFNKRMRRLYADAGHSVRQVPPAPDYSTHDAVTDRCLEAGSRDPQALEVMRLYRRALKRAA
jgi:hypothetical protein